MVDITPELLGNSFVAILITYVVAFAFQVYMLYLNWKQSKVQNSMQSLLEEVKEIKQILKSKKK